MSLDLPSDSEGSHRICLSEGADMESLEASGSGLSWRKTNKPGLVSWETLARGLQITFGEFQGRKGPLRLLHLSPDFMEDSEWWGVAQWLTDGHVEIN